MWKSYKGECQMEWLYRRIESWIKSQKRSTKWDDRYVRASCKIQLNDRGNFGITVVNRDRSNFETSRSELNDVSRGTGDEREPLGRTIINEKRGKREGERSRMLVFLPSREISVRGAELSRDTQDSETSFFITMVGKLITSRSLRLAETSLV